MRREILIGTTAAALLMTIGAASAQNPGNPSPPPKATAPAQQANPAAQDKGQDRGKGAPAAREHAGQSGSGNNGQSGKGMDAQSGSGKDRSGKDAQSGKGKNDDTTGQ